MIRQEHNPLQGILFDKIIWAENLNTPRVLRVGEDIDIASFLGGGVKIEATQIPLTEPIDAIDMDAINQHNLAHEEGTRADIARTNGSLPDIMQHHK